MGGCKDGLSYVSLSLRSVNTFGEERLRTGGVEFTPQCAKGNGGGRRTKGAPPSSASARTNGDSCSNTVPFGLLHIRVKISRKF